MEIFRKILLLHTEKRHLEIKDKNGAVLWCLSFVPVLRLHGLDRKNFGLCLPFPDLLLHLCNWKQFSALFHCVPVTFPFVSVCFCDCFCSCACVFCYQSQNSTRMVASPFEAGDALGYLLNNINSFATDNLVKFDIKQLAWILEQIFSPNGSNAHHWVYPVCCSANALAAFMFFQNEPSPFSMF